MNAEFQTRTYYDTDNEFYIELGECYTSPFESHYFVNISNGDIQTRFTYNSYTEAVSVFNNYIKDALSGVEDSTRIEVLELSVRAYNALMRANIKTIPQLLDIPKTRLKRIRNLGEKCLSEIEEAVKEHGYQLIE